MAKKKIDLTDFEAQSIINSFIDFDPTANIPTNQDEVHSDDGNDFKMEQDQQLKRIISKKKGNKHYSLFIDKESNMVVKNGTTVRIRNEHHRNILQIVQVIRSDKINIARYIDNVLSHHLDKYKDEIIELYNIKPTFDEHA